MYKIGAFIFSTSVIAAIAYKYLKNNFIKNLYQMETENEFLKIIKKNKDKINKTYSVTDGVCIHKITMLDIAYHKKFNESIKWLMMNGAEISYPFNCGRCFYDQEYMFLNHLKF